MKKISSKKSLTRKVLCSIMAAGMMGVAGTAFAATEKYPDEDCIAGSYIIDSGDINQTIPTGTYDKGVYVFGPAGVNVTGTGLNVTANNVEDTDALTFAAPNSTITLSNSNITGGVVLRPDNITATINGGTINPVFHENVYASEIEAASGQLTLKDVTINCGLVATNFVEDDVDGEEEFKPINTTPVIKVVGGTIKSVESHDVEENETEFSEVAAEGTGKVILQGVTVNCGIGAYGRNEEKVGGVEVDDSVINAGSLTAGAEIFAESGGIIDISNTNKETHKVSLDVIAFDGGKIKIQNANVVVTGMNGVGMDGINTNHDEVLDPWGYGTDGTIAALAGSSIEVIDGNITAFNNVMANNYDEEDDEMFRDTSRPGGVISVKNGNITAPNAVLVDGGTVKTINGNVTAGNLVRVANGGSVVVDGELTLSNNNAKVFIENGATLTVNMANVNGRIWNGIDADAAEEGEIGYMHSNIADGGARKDGGILTVNSGTINGTVFTGGGAKTILKDVTITTDTKVENDALTIENATAELTNTTINGGLGLRSGSLTMTGGAIKGIARSEMHDGDFENTEIDIQTGTAELTDTNINAVILVGMPGEDPNVYPTEPSKLVLNATNDTTKYTPEYILVGPKGSLVIKGGTLVAEKLKNMTTFNYTEKGVPKSATSTDGGIVLEGGTIATLSGQIFEKAIDTTSDDTVIASDSAGSVTNKTIAFNKGKLQLDDIKYTQAYVNSARLALNNSNITIYMTGQEIAGKKSITVEELNNQVGEGVVKEDKELKGDESGITINSGVTAGGVGSVDLSGTENKNVKIENKEFTITGDAEGNIAKDNGEANIVVGAKEGGNTTLNIGNGNADKEINLNGNLTVNEGSTVNIDNPAKVEGQITANKADIKVNNGALHANEMALTNANLQSGFQATINIINNLNVAGKTNVTGNVNAKKLVAEAGTVINIGTPGDGKEDKGKAGVMSLQEIELHGGTLFLDPAFKGNDEIKDASRLAVGSTALDGRYVVGQNSVMTFGSSDNSTAVTLFENAAKANENKLAWGKETISAGAYLAQAINVAGGSLIVDGSKTSTEGIENVDGTVTLAANSILMVDSSAFEKGKAIDGAENVKVDSTSKLIIANAQDKAFYSVFGKGDYWDPETNVFGDNAWVKFEKEENGFRVKFTSLEAQLGDAAPGAKVIDAVIKDTDNKAGQALSAELGLKEKDGKAKVVNNIIQATAQAGIASSAIVANAEVANAISDHLSVGAAVEEGGKGLSLNKENGSAVWAKLIHKKADVDGLKVGSIGKADYSVKQNGIVAGLDFVNTEDKAFGVAITYMDGKVTGAAAKNETENYGLSVYGKKKVGKAAIIADLSYIHGENDIKSDTITEKPKSDALSLGVKAETAIKAGVGQFVPYVGARVTRLGIGDYKDSLGIKHDSDVENLFNIPLGIKYSANIQKGNWTMRPTVDLGYVFNVGNKDGQETVSYGGTSNTFSYEMVDKSSFVGALGFEMENKNVAYNLGYQYTKGSNTKANKYMLGFKVKF